MDKIYKRDSGYYELENGEIIHLSDVFKAINYINSLDGIGSSDYPQGGWGNVIGVIKGLIQGYGKNAEYLVNNIKRSIERDEIKELMNKTFDKIKDDFKEQKEDIEKEKQETYDKLTIEQKNEAEDRVKKEKSSELVVNFYMTSEKTYGATIGLKTAFESFTTPIMFKSIIIAASPIILRKAIKMLSWKESKKELQIVCGRNVEKKIWGYAYSRNASITDCLTGEYFEVRNRKHSRHARDDVDRLFTQWATIENAKDNIIINNKIVDIDNIVTRLRL